MDLGQHSSSVEGRYDGYSTAELLTEIGSEVRGRQSSQVREWVAITAWADANVVDGAKLAATLREGFLDTGVRPMRSPEPSRSPLPAPAPPDQ